MSRTLVISPLTCRKLMLMKTLKNSVSMLSPPGSLSIAPWLLAASISPMPPPFPTAFSWAFPAAPSN